jgi:hypothetical protein
MVDLGCTIFFIFLCLGLGVLMGFLSGRHDNEGNDYKEKFENLKKKNEDLFETHIHMCRQYRDRGDILENIIRKSSNPKKEFTRLEKLRLDVAASNKLKIGIK